MRHSNRTVLTQFLVFFITLATVVGAPLQAAAEPAERGVAQSPGTNKRRLQLYERALDLSQAGESRKAYRTLLEVWELGASFDVAMALGAFELEWRNHPAAARYFEYAQKHLPPSDSAAHRDQIREGLTQARGHVGVVRLRDLPAGALVQVDRAPTALPLYVWPGTRELRVELEGYKPWTRTARVEPGEAVTLFVHLERLDPVVAPSETPSRFDEDLGEPSAVSNRSPWPVLAVGAAVTAGLAAGSVLSLTGAQKKQASVENCVAAGGCSDVGAVVTGRDEMGRTATLLGAGAGVAALGTTVIWHWVNSGEQGKSLGRRWLSGSSAGVAGIGKTLAVMGAQLVGVGAIGLGTWALVRSEGQRNDVEQESVICSEQSPSPACLRWHVRRGEADAMRGNGALWLAGAGLAQLLTLTLAEYWPNVEVSATAGPGGGDLFLRGAF